MAVDAVAPAAGPSYTDGRTSGADQHQQIEAPPAADLPQETGDLTLVYKGQEHTFSGVPQRRVPSHADITTHCTCTGRHPVTPACLLRKHLSWSCQAPCVRQLLCPRNRGHPASTDGHVVLCVSRLRCCWSCWRTAPTSMLCSQRVSRRQSTARCSSTQPFCGMTHACGNAPACVIRACSPESRALTRLGCAVQASFQRYKEKKRERRLREQQEVHLQPSPCITLSRSCPPRACSGGCTYWVAPSQIARKESRQAQPDVAHARTGLQRSCCRTWLHGSAPRPSVGLWQAPVPWSATAAHPCQKTPCRSPFQRACWARTAS